MILYQVYSLQATEITTTGSLSSAVHCNVKCTSIFLVSTKNILNTLELMFINNTLCIVVISFLRNVPSFSPFVTYKLLINKRILIPLCRTKILTDLFLFESVSLIIDKTKNWFITISVIVNLCSDGSPCTSLTTAVFFTIF